MAIDNDHNCECSACAERYALVLRRAELLDAIANVRRQTGGQTVQVGVLRHALNNLESALNNGH